MRHSPALLPPAVQNARMKPRFPTRRVRVDPDALSSIVHPVTRAAEIMREISDQQSHT